MISHVYQNSQSEWNNLSRTERFLLPGLRPGAEAPSEALFGVRWETIGSGVKLFIPALILFGKLSDPRGSLLQMTGLNLFATAAIYSDIKLHGKLRLFEIATGMMLPIALVSGFRAIGGLMQMGMIFKVLPPHPMLIAFTGIEFIPPLSISIHAANLAVSLGGLWLCKQLEKRHSFNSLYLWAFPLASAFIQRDLLSNALLFLGVQGAAVALIWNGWNRTDEESRHLRNDLSALSIGTLAAVSSIIL